ncbi:MAG: hypothetical protein KatS3mg115_2676 [Candidatus Poribacteria bacterium]|nr:MAG: hypothetical protein KatS3mg115_2676 [Candidatus Poribacteria bacterium]
MGRQYWTPKRLKIREWFGRHAKSLGELYEGALGILFSEGPVPGRVRFVSHAVREIRNRLADVIAGPKGGRLDYVSRMDTLVEEWKRAGLPTDGSVPRGVKAEDRLPTSGDVPMPVRLYRQVASLVADHVRTREKPYEAGQRLFEAIDPNNKRAQEFLRPRIQHWLEITGWFVSRVHDSGQTDDEAGAEELQGKFEIFEGVLLALVVGFFETLEEIDEILEEANS